MRRPLLRSARRPGARLRRTSALLAATLLLPGGLASAQAIASTTRGWLIHADGFGALVTQMDLHRTDAGGGGGLGGGYGFTPAFALELDVDFARMSSRPGYNLGYGGPTAVWHFRSPAKRSRPYLRAGFSTLQLTYADVQLDDTTKGDVTFEGYGFLVGAGVRLFATPQLAFDLRADYSVAPIEDVRFNGSEEKYHMDREHQFQTRAARGSLGLTYFFRKPKAPAPPSLPRP